MEAENKAPPVVVTFELEVDPANLPEFLEHWGVLHDALVELATLRVARMDLAEVRSIDLRAP